MRSYTAYGLAIQSELHLPELVEAEAGTSRPASSLVEITLGDAEIQPPEAESKVSISPDGRFWASPDAVFLRYENAGAYLIRGGRQIILQPDAGVDPRVIRLFLLGPALAMLLHQRGFLVLHASAVNIDGGAVAFLGDKGAGKSTTAAALHARGHALVCDDLVAVDASAEIPQVYPGFPQLKLFPEAAAQLPGDAESLPRIHPEFEKLARRVEPGFASRPLPFRAALELIDAEDEGVEAPSSVAAFMTLTRHSYVLPLLAATGASASHFHQAAAVAQRVPVRRLLRRRSLDVLPDVARYVEQFVAKLR